MKSFVKNFIILFFFTLSAQADLIVWQPTDFSQSFLIYKKPHETPQGAIQRFLEGNQNNTEISTFSRELKFTDSDKIQNYVHPQERTLVMANKPDDHTKEAPRLRVALERFNSEGVRTLTLPVGASLSLDPESRNRFLKEISRQFGLLVALGGDDVHPQHYQEKISWARNLKPERDALEIEIVRGYYQHSNGQILGICRGLQLTSVALGYKLNQDLIEDLKSKLPHNNGAFHDIVFEKTQNGLLRQAYPELRQISVNSYHHQSVQIQSLTKEGPLEIAARSQDGVIEALESRDGRILLLQFHPEISDFYHRGGQNLFRMIKNWPTQVPTCKQAIRKSAG